MALQFVFANNAGSTLAGPINNTTTSLNLTSGGGAIFPNPVVGNQQFEVTLIDAATGLIREITYCTARSGDTLTVIRGQENTTAQNYLAGDLAQELWTAGQCSAITQLGPIAQPGPQQPVIVVPVYTFYVNASTGSDTLYDGQAATVGGSHGPWATLVHAVSYLSQFIAFGSVTINVAAGTYAGVTITTTNIPTWIIIGAGSGSTTINSGSATQPFGPVTAALWAIGSQVNITISGFTFNDAIAVFAAAQVSITGTNVLNIKSSSYGFYAVGAGGIGTLTTATCSITYTTGSGGSLSFMTAEGAGQIELGFNGFACTMTASGSPKFTEGWAWANTGGIIVENSTIATFSGSLAASSIRYLVTDNATIATNGGGANFFPGTSAGSAQNTTVNYN